MNIVKTIIAAGFGIGLGMAALSAAPAQAQPRPGPGAYHDGYYGPAANYRGQDRRGWRDRDRNGNPNRYDRWDNRRGPNGWNGRNSWNNDRRYRQQCWKEWRYDRWRDKRYRVKVCR